ncbi:FSTL5 [Bugula neritina]|uniref:FSTL5 n=1 Tax=Bugula neritina TaxID=10212 RepID=A0A7J7JV83_BUGNE|nr:FSTL5 [Bugula neritina]
MKLMTNVKQRQPQTLVSATPFLFSTPEAPLVLLAISSVQRIQSYTLTISSNVPHTYYVKRESSIGSIMWALPLLLYLLTSCHGYNLHRHRHADFSKVGLPTEYVESVPNELKRLLPAKTESEYRIIEHANYDELATVTECSNSDYCGAGRTCLVDRHGEELCVCQGAGSCPPGHRLVCGSDGNMYDSHCELHRRACVTQKHISVDLDGSACSGNDLQKSSQSKKKDLSLSPHTPPTKSLRATTTMMRTTETGNSYKYDKSCSHTQFGEFKHLLMIYHCNRLGIAKCDSQNKSGKQHVVSRMFQYYDRDSNNKISLEELIYAQKSDNLNRLAHICSLRDLIIYSPMASPTLSSIDRTTFYHEFEVDIGDEGEEGDIDPPGDDSMITYVTADGYTGVELPCQLTNSQQIVWMRNGVEIEFDTSNSMSVLSNKDLFISAVNLDHTGNYTCYDISRPHVVITRQLIVKDGVPQPTTEWQVGQYKVPHDTQRYEWSKGNGTLTILSPSGQIDSGDYTCIGKSVTAWSTSTTNLGILPLDLYLQDDDVKSKGTYLVFHESGYTAYEPEHCFTKHSVDKHAADFISNLQEPSNTLDSLCSYEDGCDWGVAINVDNKYVYVSQPSLYRILVINVRDNLRPHM